MQEDPNKITYFASTNARGGSTPFGIKRLDRARHMYVIGKTGMGKSTLLENMAIQDIRNGEGVAFIDPHGGTADRILEYVPEHRLKDVLYFAPFDMEHPIAFNVMEDVGYDKRHLVVSGLLSAFRKIWVDAWSARMEYILSNTLLALLEYPGATLLDVNRMLVNKIFRKKVVENTKDPIVKAFWEQEFATYTDRYTQEATPAIQNKVGQFTSNPLIRNIIGQPKSSFDIRKMMDEKKILIMNLSKGRVGEVNATLLGSMLVTKIYLAAMSRADISAQTLSTLPSFYFYVDEFQTFANQSFADILSEARKYKLNLIIAHQYVEQMEEEVRDAVFGNVGTTIVFRVGPFDAEVLETIFKPQFMATDLVNLGFAQIYLTLMIDGVGSPPFSATTLPPFDPPPQSFVATVIENSRSQFSKSRIEVEQSIEKWHAEDKETPRSISDKAQARFSAPVRAPRYEPRKPALVPRPTAEVRPVQAEALGEQVAHQHAMAASKAQEPPPAPPQEVKPAPPRPPEPRIAPPEPVRPPRPPKEESKEVQPPPLEGARSLKEALARIVERSKPTPPPQQHHGALKEALGKVAPTAAAPPPQAKAPPGLPKDVLERMLAVDEEGTG